MTTSPKITYLLTHFPALSHTFISEEIDGLERNGVEVSIVSINSVRDSDRAAGRAGEWENRTFYIKAVSKARAALSIAAVVLRHPSVLAIPIRRGGTDAKSYLWWYFQVAEAILLRRHMSKAGSTHVHAHFGMAPATIAWFAAEVSERCDPPARRITWSMTIHGWHEFTQEDSARLADKIAAATFVVCISDFTKAQLTRISTPEHWDKISIVRCGIDLSKFSPRQAEDSEGQGSRPSIVMVARISPEKGHHIALEAVSQLRDRGVMVDLEVVGTGDDSYVDSLQRTVAERGLADQVRFLGGMGPDAVADRLAAATLFCLPTFAEGLPVVIMEAMARRVPVVTTFIAGIPELAINDDTALVVPAARADLLASAIERVVSDPALADQLSARALVKVSEQHDISRNVLALRDLFVQHQA